MSVYKNADAQRIRSTGGAVRVTLGTTTDNRGNGGTSLPCLGCYVQAALANTDEVYMNIDIAASADVGIELGRQHINTGQNEYAAAGCQPLWIPIDDVASLYFYSADTDAVVDILYFKGGS